MAIVTHYRYILTFIISLAIWWRYDVFYYSLLDDYSILLTSAITWLIPITIDWYLFIVVRRDVVPVIYSIQRRILMVCITVVLILLLLFILPVDI